MKVSLRSYLAGMHNPLLHSTSVLIGWIRIYKSFPSIKELICIFFHDIGYLKQDALDGEEDKHPEFGAYLCGSWFGKKYYFFCISHSRDYAKKIGVSLSKLGYADKYSILLYPNWFFKILLTIGGEAHEYNTNSEPKKWGYPVKVELIKTDYANWIKNNVIVARKQTQPEVK